MSEQKRLVYMLVTVCLLIAANVYVQMSDGESSTSFFEGLTDLEESWSEKLKKSMNDIQAMPELSFHMNKAGAESEESERNPFIFGLDMVREDEQKDRLAALAAARVEMEEQRQEVVESEVEPVVAKATFNGQFLGTMENAKTGAMLISVKYQSEYHVLQPGDTLDDTYKLVDVTPERVRLLALKSGQEIDIQLEAQ